MAGEGPELPPRDEDQLLIDALRRRPQLPIGRFMGAEVQDIAATTDESTEELLGKIDEARENLHNIHDMNRLGEKD